MGDSETEDRLAEGLFGGRIALGDEIGRGAMGVVYQGALENQSVAIKVLHPHLTSDLAVVGRFVREHQALSRIDHPNVVQVIDLIVDDPRLGIVMEHLDFPDLGKLIRQEHIDPQRSLRLGVGIAAGVAAIHEARVVHRDLKPANVLVARQAELEKSGTQQVTEVPKIADFGVSRLVGQSIVSSTTTMGTPLYMSPEAAGGASPVGRPADVYSLGVMLFEMLTGRPPYTAEEPIAIAVAHVNNPIPIVGGIPDQLSELLQTMLSKRPEDRPTAAEVERVLSSLAPHISPTLEPIVLNNDVIDLTDQYRPPSTADGHLSSATVLIAGQTANTTDVPAGHGGFQESPRTDQTMAAVPLGGGPSAFSLPGDLDNEYGRSPYNDDRTELFHSTTVAPSDGQSWDLDGSYPQPPSTGNGGSTSILGEHTLAAPQQPPYSNDFVNDHDGRHQEPHGAYRREMSATTSSSVDRGQQQLAVLVAGLLLIPLLWFGWSLTQGSSENVDVETTNAAFSFLPRVGSNGLITTRRWELTTDDAGLQIIRAEVIIANTSSEPVTATHYEAFPGAVDVGYLVSSFNPEPDEVVDDPGVALFDMGELLPRARFTITYKMLAPDGVESVEELQGLAENQGETEAAYLEDLPGRAAQEAMDTEGVLTNLTLNPATLEVEVGQISSARLLGVLSDGTTVDPAALAAAVWTIEDPEIAEVTSGNAIRGLKDGETTLTVSVGDIEADITIVVSTFDDEVAIITSTTAATTSSSATTSTTEPTTTSEETTTTSTSTTTTTEPVEPVLTISLLTGEVKPDGSFMVSFSTSLCSAASFSGASQSYTTPGWPDVGELCSASHSQAFTAVAPGSYVITVIARSAGHQEVQRTISVVVEEPDPGEDPLTMSQPVAVVNEDGSFTVSFSTNLCTIANYSGAGQSYITPGWPDVGELCWQIHGQGFTAVEPGSYTIVVRSRSADGQSARRTLVVEIPG